MLSLALNKQRRHQRCLRLQNRQTHVPPPPEPTSEVTPSPPLHHIATTVPAPVPIQQDISLTAEKHQDVDHVQQEILEVDNSNAQHFDVEENLEQPSDIPSDTVNNTALSQNSLSMQLDNVTDEIVRT